MVDPIAESQLDKHFYQMNCVFLDTKGEVVWGMKTLILNNTRQWRLLLCLPSIRPPNSGCGVNHEILRK